MEQTPDTNRNLTTVLNSEREDVFLKNLHSNSETDENTKLKLEEMDDLLNVLIDSKPVTLVLGKRRVSISEKVTIYETSVDSRTQSTISETNKEKMGARKDSKKIVLLIYLYCLQGIPLGLAASIPYLLSARGVSYSDQGTFSFAFYPYACKILWAPVVDAIFIKRFGRRKSWLVPVQFIMAVFLFSFSYKVDQVINSGNSKSEIFLLTGIFFMFIFLAATQDIALDGWAISMLSKENLSWQGTCNYIGMTIGFIMGNSLFILLESKDFSNKFFRPLLALEDQKYGLITMQQFMIFFGFIFLVSTIIVLFISEEKIKSHDHEEQLEVNTLDLTSTYKMLWKMLQNKNIRKLMLILFTAKIGYATDSAIYLKLIEYGVPRETLTLLSLPFIPLGLIWPFVLSRYIKGTKSIVFYTQALPFKLLCALVFCTFLYFVPSFKDEKGEFGYSFYSSLVLFYVIGMLMDTACGISCMAFFSNISDESVGGTYMTFLTTITNLGGTYPGTAALFLIQWFSVKICLFPESVVTKATEPGSSYSTTTSFNELRNTSAHNACQSTAKSVECQGAGGKCVTVFDSYYYLSLVFYFIGFIWLLMFRKRIRNLNNTEKASWKIQ